MEQNIVLNPTSTAQWHALIQEAKSNCNITLNEELESYLVFLLMRFINAPEISQHIMALELLESAHQSMTSQQDTLRDVGDKCLLYSGFFPGLARKRRVRISYYVKLGQTAYHSLADLSQALTSNLYHDLYLQFVPMMDVLHAMREVNTLESALDPLQAEELYQDTGSVQALNKLQSLTQSSLFIKTDNLPHQKH